QAALHDFADNRVLERLSMYERRIELSLYKSMNELQRLRVMREVQPATEKPTRPDKHWGNVRHANATDQTAPPGAMEELRGGFDGGDEALHQTKPIRAGRTPASSDWRVGIGDSKEPVRGKPQCKITNKANSAPQTGAAAGGQDAGRTCPIGE
ncbi:MAG: hypothetical protein JW741_27805, partial [Sedimentisphaerales bacterium]|nr:hypothetical protein [Sedimentisphaerales bacterium]